MHGSNSRGIQDLLPAGGLWGLAGHPPQTVQVRDVLELGLHGFLRGTESVFAQEEDDLPGELLLPLIEDRQVGIRFVHGSNSSENVSRRTRSPVNSNAVDSVRAHG